MQLKRIVIGVDLTNPSTDAAKWVANAFAPEAELVLLHCLNPLLVERRVPDVRARAESSLDELRLMVGMQRSSYRIRIGDPARCLADLAGVRSRRNRIGNRDLRVTRQSSTRRSM